MSATGAAIGPVDGRPELATCPRVDAEDWAFGDESLLGDGRLRCMGRRSPQALHARATPVAHSAARAAHGRGLIASPWSVLSVRVPGLQSRLPRGSDNPGRGWFPRHFCAGPPEVGGRGASLHDGMRVVAPAASSQAGKLLPNLSGRIVRWHAVCSGEPMRDRQSGGGGQQMRTISIVLTAVGIF